MNEIRHQGEIVEITQDCDIGEQGERGVVVSVQGYRHPLGMVLSFPGRTSAKVRNVRTYADYQFLRRIATAGEAEGV